MAEPAFHGNVLVVDDEAFVRMLIADVPDEAGFAVIEASDAQTSLKRLEIADDVQVLFTDINMPPGVNGLDLVARVHERWTQIGLFVLPGHERPSDDQIADGGVFVPKPFRPEDVVTAVQRVAPQA